MTIKEVRSLFENSNIWKQWSNDDFNAMYVCSDAVAEVTFWNDNSERFYMLVSISNVHFESVINADECSFREGFLRFKGFVLYVGYDTQEIPF